MHPEISNKQGKVLEWLKRHAWKACDRQNRFVGSNPILSAKNLKESPKDSLFYLPALHEGNTNWLLYIPKCFLSYFMSCSIHFEMDYTPIQKVHFYREIEVIMDGDASNAENNREKSKNLNHFNTQKQSNIFSKVKLVKKYGWIFANIDKISYFCITM